MNTRNETPKNLPETEDAGDLEGFARSPPAHRIDDKAATLEDELQDLKLRHGRDRFLYVFIITVLLVCLVGPNLPTALLGYIIVASLIFTISMANYLDFPWAILPLERWLDLIYKVAEKRFLGKDNNNSKTEPLDTDRG